MITKNNYFLALIFGIICNTSTMESPKNKNSSDIGINDLSNDENDVENILEKGFIIRKDCKEFVGSVFRCVTEKQYQDVLLPRQQKVVAEFPDMSTKGQWDLVTGRKQLSDVYLVFNRTEDEMYLVSRRQDPRFPRSQGHNIPRRLVGTLSNNVYDYYDMKDYGHIKLDAERLKYKDQIAMMLFGELKEPVTQQLQSQYGKTPLKLDAENPAKK